MPSLINESTRGPAARMRRLSAASILAAVSAIDGDTTAIGVLAFGDGPPASAPASVSDRNHDMGPSRPVDLWPSSNLSRGSAPNPGSSLRIRLVPRTSTPLHAASIAPPGLHTKRPERLDGSDAGKLC